MGSDQLRRHGLVDRCCNGVCFGIGFAVTTIALIAMFGSVWFYFGLTIVQVSNSQRRALVNYSYVPPSTSSPNQNTPSDVPESSLNQISKIATVSSSFPRIDPSEALEKKREILNGRSPSPPKGDFAPRPRSNKTGDVDARRMAPNGGSERKPNDEEDISQESASLPNEQNDDKSIENNDQRGTQHDERRNISANSESIIIPTRVIHSEFGIEKTTRLDQRDSAVLNSRLPDVDLTSRNPNFGNNTDLLPNSNNRDRGFNNRDDSVRDSDRSEDDRMFKGDIRIIRPPSRDDIGLREKDNDKDDRYSDSNTRRHGDVDKYDDREERYRDRIPYDDRYVEDRKREDDKYRPTSTRNNRNRDRIVEDRFADDRRDRRRGDEEKIEEGDKYRPTSARNNRNRDKIVGEDRFVDDRRDRHRGDDERFEDRYRGRTPTDQRYPDRRGEESDRNDNRDRRLNRDRTRLSPDDEYLEKYPDEERRNRGDFQDRPVRQNRYRDRVPDDDRRSVRYHDDERSEEHAERFNERYPKEGGSNGKIPEHRYRDESRRRYDDDKIEDYDRRKITEEDEYRYRDRFRDDLSQPNRTRSRTDNRYNYRDETVDSSRYNSKEDQYRDYNNDENSRSETRGTGRDSLMSSRTDYRPPLGGTKFTRPNDSTRNDRRYLSSDSRTYIGSDISDSKRDVVVEDHDRSVYNDEESDKLPRLDGRDRIAPTRVKDNRHITLEPDKRVDGSYPVNRRPAIIDTKYQINDERSRTPTHTRIESSRVSQSGRREYYPTDEIKNSPRSGKDEISLERRSYSSEDDEYRLSNTNTRSRTNLPDSTLYDDRRRDYRSDDPNKKYADEDEYERSGRTNVRDRDSSLRDDGVRYDRNGDKEDRYRDVSGRDRYYRDKDVPTDRNDRNREQGGYNRNIDRIDDRKYEEDEYDRNQDKYDDRYYEEDRYVRYRDRYDYRYKEDRYDQNRDRYDEDRYGEEIYDRNRDRYDEGRYDRNRDKYGDDAEYEESRLDRNNGKYNDDRHGEDRYDKPSELKPRDALSTQEDRIRSDSSGTRLRNTSPSRFNEQKESFPSPSDASKTPLYSAVDDIGVNSKDTRRRETSISSASDYEAGRPLSAKDVIDAALRQSESTQLVPKKVFYPVFDPRISNLTSSDIIRPSERRGITINSRRRRKREIHIE